MAEITNTRIVGNKNPFITYLRKELSLGFLVLAWVQ